MKNPTENPLKWVRFYIRIEKFINGRLRNCKKRHILVEKPYILRIAQTIRQNTQGNCKIRKIKLLPDNLSIKTHFSPLNST